MGRGGGWGRVHRPQRQNEEARGQAVFKIEFYAPKNPHTELRSLVHPRVSECWVEGGEEEVGVSARSIALEREPARPRGLQSRILRT